MNVQYVFTTEKVTIDKNTTEKVVWVNAEILDKAEGKTLVHGTFPVVVTDHGVFVEVKPIKNAVSYQKARTELLFRLKRYVKKMRDYLEPEER